MIDSFKGLSLDQTNFIEWSHTPERILEEASLIVQRNKEFNDYIAAITKPTIANTLEPSIKYHNEHNIDNNQLGFYKYVSPDKDLREASSKADRLIKSAAAEQATRADVFKVYDELLRQIKEKDIPLDAESQKFLEQKVRSFHRNGLGLSDEKSQRLKELKDEIVESSQKFVKNITEDSTSVSINKASIADVPKFITERLPVEDEKYVLKGPASYQVLRYANDQEIRKQVFLALNEKSSGNVLELSKLVRLRYELAKLLGYKSYSDYILEENITKTTENALGFLEELKRKISPIAQKEYNALLELKNEDLVTKGMEPQSEVFEWDIEYYGRKLDERENTIDYSKVTEHFPVEKTVKNMMRIYEQIFDMKFIEIKEPKEKFLWHEDVRIFLAYTNIKQGHPSNELCGTLYLDLASRPGKYTAPAMFPIKDGYYEENRLVPSYCALVISGSAPTESKPALLRHSQVTRTFHELGHCIHLFLSRAKHAKFQGPSGVPRDFVECPSQLLEFWTWSPRVLQSLSGHYETNLPLTEEITAQLERSKSVNCGNIYLKRIHNALFDLKIHSISEKSELDAFDPVATWNELRYDLGIPSSEGVNKSFTTFGQLSDHYASSYYTYLYGLSLAADIFYSKFKEDPLSVEAGLEYRQIVLSRGGTLDIEDILEELLGRPPNSEAFERDLSIST
ncbi:hypothetical protein CJJ07_000303 [Candidozyma auris]|nr:hypothetical protein CJJ07_000303 [[Candida] auris]